jgi:hypothetical protein
MTMDNQTVHGDGAIARINGRASFADETIDSTVTLEDGTDRYVTMVKGPLAAPALNTTRSSAR